VSTSYWCTNRSLKRCLPRKRIESQIIFFYLCIQVSLYIYICVCVCVCVCVYREKYHRETKSKEQYFNSATARLPAARKYVRNTTNENVVITHTDGLHWCKRNWMMHQGNSDVLITLYQGYRSSLSSQVNKLADRLTNNYYIVRKRRQKHNEWNIAEIRAMLWHKRMCIVVIIALDSFLFGMCRCFWCSHVIRTWS
jgi:hypothetical protein